MSKVNLNAKPWRCIGDNIRILLAVRNMPRKEFAKRMMISTGQLSRWITGYTAVPTESIYKAANILKVNPEELMVPIRYSENCVKMEVRQAI